MRLFELAKKSGLGLTIFDIDDTLFRTTAQIKVVKDGREIRSLNNQEFNTYKLQDGESFDFGEFRNAEKFNRESIPIEPMLAKLKAILRNAGDSKVIMLTARSDFDNKELFLDTFKKYGVDMDKVHVHRAGNLGGSPSGNKAVWIRKYLDTGKFGRVRLYDDAMSNIKMFIDLQKEYPDVDFFPYFVTHEGGIKTIREDGRIVKGVNTTVDVGVDQTRIEAAKFGNTVTKDGVPPTLRKQVKGSSTNVLFNLGLTESEETDRALAGAAGVATVSSAGAAGRLAWQGLKYVIAGILNIHPEDVAFVRQQLSKRSQDAVYKMAKDGGRVEPSLRKTLELTPRMRSDAMKKLISDIEAKVAKRAAATASRTTGAGRGGGGRIPSINDNPIQGGQTQLGLKWLESKEPRYTASEWAIIEGGHSLEDIKPTVKKPGRIFNALTQKDEDPTYNTENFADGRKPGRKGLAKRSGVNTKASVSSLRKTAKNSSGEKQRMAHWLANMKAGRKKKK
jgi:hypothetical protein